MDIGACGVMKRQIRHLRFKLFWGSLLVVAFLEGYKLLGGNIQLAHLVIAGLAASTAVTIGYGLDRNFRSWWRSINTPSEPNKRPWIVIKISK